MSGHGTGDFLGSVVDPSARGTPMAQRVNFDPPNIFRLAKRTLIAFVVGVGAIWIGCASTIRVDAGHVGVKVKLTGNERGVQPSPMTPGWHLYNPITEQVI